MREGWTYKKLGEVCEILNGFAFKSGNYTEQGIRVLRITNVQKGLIVDDDPKYYPFNEETNLKQYMLKEGDLLMSLTGNVGRVGLLQKNLLPAALNQRVACLRIKNSNIQLEYIFHLLNSDCFERDCIFNATGIAQKNMSTEWLKKYNIPIPSLSEQQTIVAELDKINELISLKKAQLDDLDALAQSIFYDMFGDPIENEKGWEVKKLEDVCKTITDGDHMPPPKSENGIPFITISDINKETREIDFNNTFYVPQDYYDGLKEERKAQVNDLLYTVTGSYGIPVVVKSSMPFCFQRHIALIRPIQEKLLTIFLCWWVLCPSVKGEADRVATGIAQKTVGLNSIRQFNIILPPLTLQQEFAKRIELIEQQKAQISSTIKDLETLLASRMQYWFD